MNCGRAQSLLSSRMDGEHLSSLERARIDAHVSHCAACQGFEERAARVRTAIRIRPAERIPDLTDEIMARVALEAAHPTGGRAPRRRSRRWKRSLPAIAAALAGMLVGSLIVGGPWPSGRRQASAASIARQIRSVAPSIDAFQGSYLIHEHGLAPDLPDRQLQMDVAFLAPQRFRLDIRDLTVYPSTAWTPTDLTYIEDMPATYRSGPTGCPAMLPPEDCPPTRTTITTSSPYSAAAPLPADLIVPIATFGSVDGILVVGEEDVDGRRALRVEMSFARAAPLFPFLRLGGTWRPVFEGDRVVVWLDTAGWFPVRYEVLPSPDPERRSWEMRYGLPHERADAPIFAVELAAVSDAAPDPASFAIPGLRRSDDVPLADARERLGYVPVVPADTGHLELVSLVAPSEAPVSPSSVLLYAAGLDYLRVGEDPSWTKAGPFGPVAADAQPVSLPGGGVGLYEPAGDGFGRRLAIHAADTDLFLETNLPRDELFSIASSLPMRVAILPDSWRIARAGPLTIERIPEDEALSGVGLPAVPAGLPLGYVVSSATRTSLDGIVVGTTLTFRQRETDAAGPPLTLHAATTSAPPRAAAGDQVRVMIGSLPGRWTPSISLLEWEANGGYRSLRGDVSLRILLGIASSMAGSTS